MNPPRGILLGLVVLGVSSSLAHADLRAGLVAHYTFDGNADDASGNGHHGTVNGATLTADRDGVPNRAYLFDGVDDFIQVADTQALRLSGTDYTIAAWVMEVTRDVSYLDSIAGKRGACNTCGWIFGIRGSADSARVGRVWQHMSGGGSPYGISDTPVPLGEWHHVAVVYQQSGDMTFYLDAQYDGMTPNMPTPNASESKDLFIGRDSQNTQYYFDGAIDELRIYDTALTAAEIGDLFDPTPGQAYCFGDPGSDTPCPCGNDNDGSVPESGCANGAFASGAQLVGSGDASLTADTLILAATGLEPSSSGLYFQANNDLSPGLVWGDGLRCAGGQAIRLGYRLSDATGSSDTSGYPQPISLQAGNIQPGDTKYYQCWYGNPTGSPCASGFNTTNGYAITWGP